jgi:hypothetical protein
MPFPRIPQGDIIQAPWGGGAFGAQMHVALPNLLAPDVLLGSAYAQLGHLEEAREETAEVLRINPGSTIETFKLLAVYRNPHTPMTSSIVLIKRI